MSTPAAGNAASASGRQAAQAVGGSRTAARRQARKGASGRAGGEGAAAGDGSAAAPQNNNNIMKFYGDDGAGLKVGPVTVLVMSLAFMVCVVVLHILSKFRAALAG